MPHDHYFASDPGSASRPKSYRDTLCGRDVTFWTDHGVFSRGHTDTGTRELLAAVEVGGATRILDLGCGYGPIGVALALVAPGAAVTMLDPNERAVELARRNAELNGASNARSLPGEGFAALVGEEFDLIVTNPPIRAGNAVVFSLIADSAGHLAPGGSFYLVARTSQGARTFAREMARHFHTVEQVGQGSGFRVYRAIK